MDLLLYGKNGLRKGNSKFFFSKLSLHYEVLSLCFVYLIKEN